MAEFIEVVEGTRPLLRKQIVTRRDETNPGGLAALAGYVVRLLVKRQLSDAVPWISVDGTVDETNSYVIQLTEVHTLLPPGTWPGELRWWSPPDAPATEPADALAGAGAGNVDNGAHFYKVTFVSPRGESDGSPASDGVTVADKTTNGKVAVTAIPVGPTGTTARKLYRTVAGDADDGEYLLVATISDNSTTTYEDNVADGSLGAALAAAASEAYPPDDAVDVFFTIKPRAAGL